MTDQEKIDTLKKALKNIIDFARGSADKVICLQRLDLIHDYAKAILEETK